VNAPAIFLVPEKHRTEKGEVVSLKKTCSIMNPNFPVHIEMKGGGQGLWIFNDK